MTVSTVEIIIANVPAIVESAQRLTASACVAATEATRHARSIQALAPIIRRETAAARETVRLALPTVHAEMERLKPLAALLRNLQ